MKVFYSDVFVLDLPEQHRFPIQKYRRLRERLIATGCVTEAQLLIPAPATDAQILRAHCPDYVRRVHEGSLDPKEIRRIGFPWSPMLVERSRRSCGATVQACLAAWEEGVSVNLAGGTHHASFAQGQGYCVFNDAAIAAREMLARGLVSRVAVIDCDVHQGNGTAAIFAEDPSVFTFSIHGANNFPFHKSPSDLDVALDDDTHDLEYLDALDQSLRQIFLSFRPELVIYVSGADPFVGDRLGRLALSKNGLLARDQLVFSCCRRDNVPVAVAMAGGYAPNIEDIVDIHAQTVSEASSLHRI